MTIPGLTGELRVRPAIMTPTVSGVLPRRGSSIGRIVFGRTESLSSHGMVVANMLVRHEGPYTDEQLCEYDGGDGGQHPGAFGPGCPGATFSGEGTTIGPGGWGGDTLWSIGTPPGKVGLGGNLTTTSLNPSLATFGWWMSFNPTTPADSAGGHPASGRPTSPRPGAMRVRRLTTALPVQRTENPLPAH